MSDKTASTAKAILKAKKAIAIAKLINSTIKHFIYIVKNHRDDGLGLILAYQLKGQYEAQLIAIRSTQTFGGQSD